MVRLIVTNNLPFSLIEANSLFKELFKFCNPSVEQYLFKADALTDHVMLMFIEGREKVKAIFKELNSKISLTLDLWTSPKGLSILGITSHFIDNDYRLRELFLDAFEMHGQHTGEKIANNIISSLR
jgi:hypothetical protein